MSIIAPKPKEFIKERPAPGVYQAVCQSVHDLGNQQTFSNGQPKISHQIVIVWEIDERLKTGDFAGQRFVISKKYNLSMHERSFLAKDILSWFGKAAPMDFDLEKLIGCGCQISLVNAEKGDKVYQNISAIMPLSKGIKSLKPELPADHVFKWIAALQEKAISTEKEKLVKEFFKDDDIQGEPFFEGDK